MAADLQIRTIVSQPFEENTYVVWRAGRKDALVIDPGLEPDVILDFLKESDFLTERRMVLSLMESCSRLNSERIYRAFGSKRPVAAHKALILPALQTAVERMCTARNAARKNIPTVRSHARAKPIAS